MNGGNSMIVAGIKLTNVYSIENIPDPLLDKYYIQIHKFGNKVIKGVTSSVKEFFTDIEYGWVHKPQITAIKSLTQLRVYKNNCLILGKEIKVFNGVPFKSIRYLDSFINAEKEISNTLNKFDITEQVQV